MRWEWTSTQSIRLVEGEWTELWEEQISCCHIWYYSRNGFVVERSLWPLPERQHHNTHRRTYPVGSRQSHSSNWSQLCSLFPENCIASAQNGLLFALYDKMVLGKKHTNFSLLIIVVVGEIKLEAFPWLWQDCESLSKQVQTYSLFGVACQRHSV